MSWQFERTLTQESSSVAPSILDQTVRPSGELGYSTYRANWPHIRRRMISTLPRSTPAFPLRGYQRPFFPLCRTHSR